MNFSHFIAAVIGVFLFWGCALVGSNANREAWEADCEKLGAHRSGDTVYKCEKAPNDKPK